MLFHVLSFVEYLVRLKNVRALRNAAAQTGTKIAMGNAMIVKAFSAPCRLAKLPSPFKVITSYIIFDQQLVQITSLTFCVNGFSPNKRNEFLEDVTGALSGPDRVDPEAYGRTGGQDLHFTKSRMPYLIGRRTQSKTMRCTSWHQLQ